MNDEPPKQPHGIGWYAAWIVLALVLYVLGIGPVCFLEGITRERPRWLWRTVDAAYAPLWAVIEHLPDDFTALALTYVNFWVVLATGKPIGM